MNNSSKELAHRARLHALRMTNLGGGSHIGSCFSVTDILAVMYSGIASVDPTNPQMPERDRVILSKGHAGAALYAVLAESGFFPVSKLDTHYQDGSDLCGHVSHHGIPGVEISTGSLGHGLSIAVGMAKAAKISKDSHRVFCVMSDGECDEGAVWEAALFASHHRLDNLIAVVDYNKIQSLAPVQETLGLEPFAAKWSDFGWSVIEVDGHDHSALFQGFESACAIVERPTMIIAHTVKGKGVSFMEHSVLWHYRVPRGEEYEAARQELLAKR